MKRFLWYQFIKRLHNLLQRIPDWECKTIGNMHPRGLHCGSCTIGELKKAIKYVYTFWTEDDRWKQARS